MAQAHKQLLDPANYGGLESGLTWLGVAGLIDPPRPEVKQAIEDCVRAGIRVSEVDRHSQPNSSDLQSRSAGWMARMSGSQHLRRWM